MGRKNSTKIHWQIEEELPRLLVKYNFNIIRKRKEFNQSRVRPDLIVSKNGEQAIVEIKVQNIITNKVLYQIAYYMRVLNIEKGYLAIRESQSILKTIEKKLLNSNIGIIRIGQSKINITEPVKKTKLRSKEAYEKGEQYTEQEELREDISVTRHKLDEFNKQFWLYIFIGGLLVYLITNLLEFYFADNGSIYLWITFTLVVIIMLMYYVKLWKK